MPREEREVDEAMRQLGERVREHRLAKGMTIVDLAGQADLSRAFVADLETGHRAASLRALVRLSRALGTTAVKLLQGIEEYDGRTRVG